MSNQAPIVQLLLTAQFQPIALSLTVVDWAGLRELFADQFPIFTQIPRAGPMPMDPNQFVFDSGTGMPRLQMASADLSSIIMVQDDRVSFGWTRTVPLTAEPNYPGFEATLARAMGIFEKAIAFINERSNTDAKFSVGELAYTDSFISFDGERQVRRLQDIFNTVNSYPDFSFSNFELNYRRFFSGEFEETFVGSSQTVISGFTPTVDGNLATNLQITVRFDIEDDTPTLSSRYEQAHDVSQIIFRTLVKPSSYTISEAS